MPRILSVAALAALLWSTACDRSNSRESELLAPSPVNFAPTPSSSREDLTGPAVVQRVAAQYPERLAGGVSLEQRVANVEFLRDRIVELGNCSGLLLARNRKTNGQISVDAINWRHGSADINDVVDIASAYDDAGRSLQLHWIVVDGPAGWAPVATDCR